VDHLGLVDGRAADLLLEARPLALLVRLEVDRRAALGGVVLSRIESEK
jgi:hypothetical protein